MLAVLLAAVLTATPAPSPGADQATLGPYQIFAHARAYWERQRYPTMVGYTVHVTAVEHGALTERHYLARWSAETDAVAMVTTSIEEQEHPYRPSGGFSFGIPLIGGFNVGGSGTGINGDILAVPVVAPNYFFGMASYTPPRDVTPAELVAQVREQFHDPAPEKVSQLAASDGLPTIATVTAFHRDYDIQLLGIEPYGDHRDFHLSLKPLEDPAKYRLRELWINTTTFATDQLINQGNFDAGPATGIPWTVTFNDVDGARYITAETANATVTLPGPTLTLIKPPIVSYGKWTISFENILAASGPFFGSDTSGPRLAEP